MTRRRCLLPPLLLIVGLGPLERSVDQHMNCLDHFLAGGIEQLDRGNIALLRSRGRRVRLSPIQTGIVVSIRYYLVWIVIIAYLILAFLILSLCIIACQLSMIWKREIVRKLLPSL